MIAGTRKAISGELFCFVIADFGAGHRTFATVLVVGDCIAVSSKYWRNFRSGSERKLVSARSRIITPFNEVVTSICGCADTDLRTVVMEAIVDILRCVTIICLVESKLELVALVVVINY